MAFERADLPGEWQLPQGGIDRGEEPLEAAWRELEEETGPRARPTSPRRRASVAGWSTNGRAEFRDKRRGQVQRWFFFERRPRSTSEPVVDGVEFQAWRWCTPEWLVYQVVEFRAEAYARSAAKHILSVGSLRSQP